jgi:toxin FitB
MSFLLDTNVVSEWVKSRPNSGVVSWLAAVDEDRVFISVVTLAELRYGIERMAEGRRRNRLEGGLRNELPTRFEGRAFPVDSSVADARGARSRPTARPEGGPLAPCTRSLPQPPRRTVLPSSHGMHRTSSPPSTP